MTQPEFDKRPEEIRMLARLAAIGLLREAKAGMPVKELCRQYGFGEASYLVPMGFMLDRTAEGRVLCGTVKVKPGL